MISAFPSAGRRGLLNGLRKGQLLGLEGRRGARIQSRRGAVWLTQDGDLTDVVLNPGDTYELVDDGHVLIQALDPACVSIEPTLGAESPAWWRRLRHVVGLGPIAERAA